ncbi:hypothetical protein CVT26_000273, partial [Gymnopilus dilepis]
CWRLLRLLRVGVVLLALSLLCTPKLGAVKDLEEIPDSGRNVSKSSGRGGGERPAHEIFEYALARPGEQDQFSKLGRSESKLWKGVDDLYKTKLFISVIEYK